MQESKSNVKCPCKNHFLHEYTEAKNNHEVFLTSQFSYCPLIWMFHSRRINSKTNSTHERALTVKYQDNMSTFQELLNKNNFLSIHHRNWQVLTTEKFKIHRVLSPEVLKGTFLSKTSSQNLRRKNTFEIRQVHSVYYGTESI